MTKKNFDICSVFKHKRNEKKITDEVSNFDESTPADFETAISATSFGKFNIIYLLIAIPSGWASQFESTTMSYVFPAAQCDLNLSLQDKGMLNAITYLGMVSSAFFWGYIADSLGRKRPLIFGYLLCSFFGLLGCLSQTLPMLLFSKYMSGFMICGPFAVLTTSLSEFHAAKYRAVIIICMGVTFSMGNVLLPLLGWTVLPLSIELSINGSLVLHSWNVYIFITALPSLISGFAHMFLPESPKFLMTTGRNEEALEVFRKVYSCNTGKPPETFPIKILVDEIQQQNEKESSHGGHMTANRSKLQALKEGFQQITPLFFPPHLGKLIMVCGIQTGIMAGLNTLRLWLPQIFQAINDYSTNHPDNPSHLCDMLANILPDEDSTTCSVNFVNDSVYINGMIVSSVQIGGYVIVGTIINKLGKKTVLSSLGCISGICGICLYYAQNSATVLALSSIVGAASGICANCMLSVVVDLFPTTLRTMTVSIIMMMGRLGAMSGNLIFPPLLTLGCLPPFAMIGGVTLVCAFLTLFLPKTDLKPLE